MFSYTTAADSGLVWKLQNMAGSEAEQDNPHSESHASILLAAGGWMPALCILGLGPCLWGQT